MFLTRDRVFDGGFEFFVEFHIFLCIQIINWMEGRHKNKRQLLQIHENSRKNTNHHKNNMLCGQQLVDGAAHTAYDFYDD